MDRGPEKGTNRTEGPADSGSVTSIARYTLTVLTPAGSSLTSCASSCCLLCLSPALTACLIPSLVRGYASCLLLGQQGDSTQGQEALGKHV